MAYQENIYQFEGSIEHEFFYAGNYGAKGEKRAKRVKATPEQIKRQNQTNKENKVRRLIKANFTDNDLFITLKYPRGKRLKAAELQKHVYNFCECLRKKYKRRGQELKFIYRAEIGKHGGLHVHMVVNNIDNAYLIIQSTWKHGTVFFESIYEQGGYWQLASYLVKKPEEEAYKQLCLFPEEEHKQFLKYSTSRNLKRVEPVKKNYSHWTMRKMLCEGIKAKEGYFIDLDSVKQGINKFTGMSWLKYTEIKIKPRKKRKNTSNVESFLIKRA